MNTAAKSVDIAGFHRLRSISVTGGFLDGTRFDLSDGLNCLIGARGTGKTTALEFVRFALDAMPDDVDACRRVESLVDHNLNFGRVELGIETKDGLAYVVTRMTGEEPVVLTEDRKPTEITLKAGGLFKADIFSQNEVENIADRSLSQLELIDNFEAEQITDLNTKLKHMDVELRGNASAIIPLQDKIATLDEELATLPGLDEKLKGLSATGGSDAEAINEAHAQKALRDREKRAIEELSQFLMKYDQGIGEFVGQLQQQAETYLAKDMLTGLNKAILAEVQQSILACAREVDELLRGAQDRIKAGQDSLSQISSKLAIAHSMQEVVFGVLMEKYQAALGQATERSHLEKVRNGLLMKKRERDEATERLAKLQAERTVLLRKLSEVRDARFKVRKEVTDRISKALTPNIHVTIVQDGNRERYLQLVEEALRGARLKPGLAARKIANALWPTDLVKIVKSKKTGALVDKAELTADQAEKVVFALNDFSHLHELETVELIDEPKIELNDGGTYKDLQSLSTGQKCTTILPILLLESKNPLLVDQPEDNLDNGFICQTVVESLRTVKAGRQLIFVTHNPNIPVLGDADKVFVLESDGTSGRIVKEGDVDECKTEIVTLLEGGEKAFKLRKERYNY